MNNMENSISYRIYFRIYFRVGKEKTEHLFIKYFFENKHKCAVYRTDFTYSEASELLKRLNKNNNGTVFTIKRVPENDE